MRAFSSIINLGLMALVWWSANKLTWDCTYIDEKEEDAGRGLMTEVGRRLAASGPTHLEGDEDAADKLEMTLPLAHAAVRAGVKETPKGKLAPRLRMFLALFDDAVMPALA